MIILPNLATSLIIFSLKGWENVLVELGSERINGRKTRREVVLGDVTVASPGVIQRCYGNVARLPGQKQAKQDEQAFVGVQRGREVSLVFTRALVHSRHNDHLLLPVSLHRRKQGEVTGLHQPQCLARVEPAAAFFFRFPMPRSTIQC